MQVTTIKRLLVELDADEQFTARDAFSDTQVRARHLEVDGQTGYVDVKGPKVKKDGTLSAHNGSVSVHLDDMPQKLVHWMFGSLLDEEGY